ncbi:MULTISPECIES: class I SAM-dependent methyltransferase [unclassified Lactobacillus]|uniref:class I SAM-dependent methyltransferase n=1 Tax=unclassified Lactobacillus TaxID=2620435 RepID=UPI0018F4819F|nr:MULTISPECIES: class I SAM-dependent methyltransferase [unclassified Lactobacillus]
MFWYDKSEPHTIYMDSRSETNEVKDRDYIRSVIISPDIVGDFREMTFEDETFDLVIFDPPHLKQAGEYSWLRLKYGVLPEEDWQEYIKQGFDECMRVLKPTGTLLFKWSNNQIEFSQVFKAIGRKPILGDRRGSTRWSVFIKGDNNDGK